MKLSEKISLYVSHDCQQKWNLIEEAEQLEQQIETMKCCQTA